MSLLKIVLLGLLSLLVMFVVAIASPSLAQQNCSPAYPDVCIPPPPPDLDCAEVSYTNFRVVESDPHHFDGDKDGIGCEAPIRTS